MKEYIYNRKGVIDYAKEWALKRNPKYFNFDNFGGDCTNFASQCLYYGSNVMNYTPTFGWYYKTSFDRTPSWTGVEFFFNFLLNNQGLGPFGSTTNISDILIGDFVQLGHQNDDFYHTLIVTDIIDNELLVSAHTFDVFNKPLRQYSYDKLRCIHIKGVRY